MTFVLDASVAVAWKLPDEGGKRPLDLLARLEDGPATVPFHWRAEVANALLSAERKKRIAPAEVSQLLQELGHLPIAIDLEGGEQAFMRVMPLARAHALTIYDAIYLELAERRGLALATLDKDMRSAAKSVGVEVLP